MSELYEFFEYTSDAVFGIDENRLVRFWNKACEKLLGYTMSHAVGRPCAELLCGKDLLGKDFCGPNCSIAKFHDAQLPNEDFDLLVQSETGQPVIVNIGSYYPRQQHSQQTNQVQVFHSMRRINCHKLIQRLSNNSCTDEDENIKLKKLSKREYELLRLMSQGNVTADIAQRLGISPATVRNHIKNIFSKLEVHNRAEAISYAMRQGAI